MSLRRGEERPNGSPRSGQDETTPLRGFLERGSSYGKFGPLGAIRRKAVLIGEFVKALGAAEAKWRAVAARHAGVAQYLQQGGLDAIRAWRTEHPRK